MPAVRERDRDVVLPPDRAFGGDHHAVFPVHAAGRQARPGVDGDECGAGRGHGIGELFGEQDRKSTRLNSSHGYISYAVFCLKKKKKKKDFIIRSSIETQMSWKDYSVFVRRALVVT